MKTLEQIKTDDDLLDYIEGCLNDFEAGISTKDETHRHLADLVLFVAKRAKESCDPRIIDFAVYLTGHDRETVTQMYEDWKI